VTAVRIGLQVVLVGTSLFQILLILLHKGKGGGLSDMFGGGVSSSLGGSSVAEKNLSRFTIAMALIWSASIIGLGLIERFTAAPTT
jgi:preprotein translocase subunit SecG